MTRRARRAAVLTLPMGCVLLALPSHAVSSGEQPPPSPYAILELSLADPPPFDAVSFCVPGNDPRLAATVGVFAREGFPSAMAALEGLAADDAGEVFAAELAVLQGALAARRERPTAETREALRAAAQTAPTPLAEACAWLELARLQLVTGRLPEARADSQRALRAYAPEVAPGPIRRAAEHYRAESLYLSGYFEAARGTFEDLAEGGTPVARAARLRLADLEHVAVPTRERRTRLEALIEAESRPLTTPGDWAARIGEWALADGDAAAALTWLERAPADLSARERAAISIRRADALYLQGRADEGERILRRLANEGASEPLRQLATVRLIDLESPAGEEPLAHLRRAARSEQRGLSLYARATLADQLSAAGENEAALDALVEIAYENAAPEIVGSVGDRFDEVLASLASRDDCIELLATLGGRRTLLLEHARIADPFLRLGDCYLELGMPRAARDVFRSATRTFGPDLAKLITLRSARAEMEIGEVDSARAAARANIQLITVPVRDWRLLYGEILIDDGRPGDAIPVLMPVARDVANGALARRDATHTLWLLARAAAAQPSTREVRARLRAGLDRLTDQIEPAPALAETLLLTADLHRMAGEGDAAEQLYGRALARLPAGPLHSMAAYWQGALAGDVDEARALWGSIADAEDAWALLARNELSLGRTRASLGRANPPVGAPVPAPVTAPDTRPSDITPESTQ